MPVERHLLQAGGLLITAMLAAGCGTSDGTTRLRQTETQHETCRAGTAMPISERVVRRTLAARGFRLNRDGRCDADARVLVTLSNTDGDLFCDVLRSDLFGPRIERFVWRNDPSPTHLRVLNVACAIYPQTQAVTDKLEGAYRDLTGVSTKATTLPSADAIHD
jgi:hypothetical protein